MPKGNIWLVERNIRIYGELGVRQYYGYTKAEAIKKYKDECESKIIQGG